MCDMAVFKNLWKGRSFSMDVDALALIDLNEWIREFEAKGTGR